MFNVKLISVLQIIFLLANDHSDINCCRHYFDVGSIECSAGKNVYFAQKLNRLYLNQIQLTEHLYKATSSHKRQLSTDWQW
jgi:hypothetical protein